MPKSDPHFSQLSQDAREEVFERLHTALNELATYYPMARQNPYRKTFILKHLNWEGWAFHSGGGTTTRSLWSKSVSSRF
jgi:hypothetical protein